MALQSPHEVLSSGEALGWQGRPWGLATANSSLGLNCTPGLNCSRLKPPKHRSIGCVTPAGTGGACPGRCLAHNPPRATQHWMGSEIPFLGWNLESRHDQDLISSIASAVWCQTHQILFFGIPGMTHEERFAPGEVQSLQTPLLV